VRVPVLTKRFRAEIDRLAPHGSPERAAVVVVVRSLVEASAPLPGPDDSLVHIPQSVIGRAVPGTDLVVTYRPGITFLPGLEEVPILALLHSPRV
jgi:hypothetical protein